MRAERVAIGVRPVLADTLDFQARWQVPPVSPTLGFQVAMQRFASSVGSTIVLDGEGGDELFGLRPYLLADVLCRGRAIKAWRLAHDFADDPGTARRALALFGVRGAVPARLHRLRPARRPAWLRDDVDFELPADTTSYAWKSLRGPRWQAEARDQLTAARERMGAHDHLRRRSAMAGSVAVHPFLQDLDLIELALQLPPEHGFSAGYDRPALRDAMRGELPEAVRLRTEKSYFNHLFEDALNGPDRSALEVLLAPGAEISALVRPDFLRQLLEMPEEGRRGVWSWTAWRFAAAESWLGLQSDPSGV
jgi:asparagine synthase (glutamine-hydrolysing)